MKSTELTNTQDVEAKALSHGLIHQLIREAVKAHMSCEIQGANHVVQELRW